MVYRAWLNKPQIKPYKRGAAAIADVLAVFAVIGLIGFVVGLAGQEKRAYTPLFDRFQAGGLKEGDFGQLTADEIASLAAFAGEKIIQKKACNR